MPQYKLTYLNGRGRAEVIRMILAYAGVDYEDIRVELEEVPQLKPTLPNGQVPIMEIEGETYCQSLAISRFLAKKYGLHGKTPLDELRIDMVVYTISDILESFVPVFREKDPVKKEELRKTYQEEKYPLIVQNLEKMLVANKGGNGYFVGDGLTWADLMIFQWLKIPAIPMVGAKVDLSKAPKLEALYQRVQEEPKLQDWFIK